MTVTTIAGMLGPFLIVCGSLDAAAQPGPSSPGAAASFVQLRLPEPPATSAGEPGAVDHVIRRAYPPNARAVDPGIFVPPRRDGVEYLIRRLYPRALSHGVGCGDPGCLPGPPGRLPRLPGGRTPSPDLLDPRK